MGRPKRIQFAGACYLVVLQGNNRQDLFLSNQDRRQFLSLLRACKDRFALKVYAYALMAGRVELLLETIQPNLSNVMQAFNTQYTKYFNAAHNAVGHVFQGRYKAWVVDKETHLSEMTRWVHLACVRDGLKDKPWRYQWSSCAAYVEAENREPLVDSEAVLRKFSGPRLKQSVRYMQYLKDRVKAGGDDALPVVGGLAIGGEAFLSRLSEKLEEPVAPRAVPVEAARRIIAEVASRHGVAEEKILGRLQWREVTAVRREAVHRVWKETRMGVSDLARLFQRTPSAISQLIRAAEEGGRPSMN
ncbi:MAG: transposase [Elusimicrobia bacterium]|nr:transposase [Elusimicrobiota bacterium]